MRVASRRFWMWSLSRSASSCRPCTSGARLRFLAIIRRLRQHRRRADDCRQRRAQFVRHRPDQRLAQGVRLLAHLGLAHIGRQLARHHRDDDEENRGRRDESGCGHGNRRSADRRRTPRPRCCQRRDHRRHHAAADCGEQHGNQIDDGDSADVDEFCRATIAAVSTASNSSDVTREP